MVGSASGVELERREHGAVVGGPRLEPDVDVRVARLADELAVERLDRTTRVDVVDPVAGAALLEVGVVVGEPGIGDAGRD